MNYLFTMKMSRNKCHSTEVAKLPTQPSNFTANPNYDFFFDDSSCQIRKFYYIFFSKSDMNKKKIITETYYM